MPISFINARDGDDAQLISRLRRQLSPRGEVMSEASRAKTIELFGADLSPAEVVRRICEDVRVHGREAVLDYTEKLDHVRLSHDEFRVPLADLQQAHQQAESALLAAVRHVRSNIQEFQRAILHRDVVVHDATGSALQHVYRPLRRVGLCIPGGAAAYPSSLLMTAIPAQIAGVDQIVVVAPPTANGSYNRDLLATCHELELTDVYRIGGAQAVAALAYGVEGLPGVDKIVGPGNLFVALAKKQVYGEVDIDSIAGPSEVVVIADASASAEIVAAELLAQAEHAPGSSILITWCEELTAAVSCQLDQQLPGLPRSDLISTSLDEFSALLLVRNEEHACRLADQLAPEHLQLSVSDPSRLIARIRNAGAIFAGPYSPVAAGDYAAGPSHVLPTSGTARWASGLTANSFLRSHSVIQLSPAGLTGLADSIQVLTEKEGLQAHWRSVQRRLRQ